MLAFETFMPLQSDLNGDPVLTLTPSTAAAAAGVAVVPSPPPPSTATKEISFASAAAGGFTVEVTVAPNATAGSSAGVAFGKAGDCIYVGVSMATQELTVEQISASAAGAAASNSVLATVSLNKTVVSGWNMLRVRISTDSDGAAKLDCFFNPTHTDKGGADRGLRLSAQLHTGSSGGVVGASSVTLMAVGAAAKFDYVGAYTAAMIASMIPPFSD